MPEFQRFTRKDRQDQLKFAACSGVALLLLGGLSIVVNKAKAFSASYNLCLNAKYTAEKDHSDEFSVLAPVYEDQTLDVVSLPYIEPTCAVDAAKDVHEVSKYATLFSDSYYDLNTALLEYASKYASFDFHDVQFDGLAVMAQANTESDYMCDATESISALYSKLQLCLCMDVWRIRL